MAHLSPDCFCDGAPGSAWCPPCIAAAAVALRHQHPNTLSVSMLKRRIPGITGHTAAIVVEITTYLPVRSLAEGTYPRAVDFP